MKREAKLLVMCLCILATFVACGGGGGSSGAPAGNDTGVVRTDLLYGYFGFAAQPAKGPWWPPAPTTPTQADEVARTVNVTMTGGWFAPTDEGRRTGMQEALETMRQSQGYGVQKFVVMIDFLLFSPGADNQPVYRGPSALDDLSFFFGMLRNAGMLANVIAVYPQDEPNITMTDRVAQRQAFTDVRSFLAAQPDATGIKLMSIYAPLRFGMQNFDLIDWVGLDDYEARDNVFAEYDQVRQMLTASQRLVVVPGGANPWKQDPQPFVDYANRTAGVVMVMPFVWFDSDGTHGIRSNGMASTYNRVGCQIRHEAATC